MMLTMRLGLTTPTRINVERRLDILIAHNVTSMLGHDTRRLPVEITISKHQSEA